MHRTRFFGKTQLTAVAAIILLPQLLHAQWQATVGAQSDDKGRQALAFLPNEIWIHPGDSITWTFVTDEPHTVTFLTDGQVRNSFDVGCPGYSPSGVSFDGTTCVSTPPTFGGATFTVVFPATGNFKLSCLFHENMEGAVHVIDRGMALPHDQAFYDNQAKSITHLVALPQMDGMHDHASMGASAKHSVRVGGGKILATPGGSRTLSLMRFTDSTITIHAGDTVEWYQVDPITPHTITFGEEPVDLFDPSSNVTVDPDGARHATINSTSDSVHSGFIQASPQDRIGLPQAPLGVTRFRVTYTKAGTYPYICALHDILGMVGTVVVK